MSGYTTFNLQELLSGEDTFDAEAQELAMKSINEIDEQDAEEAGMFVDPNTGTIFASEAEYHEEMQLCESHNNFLHQDLI